MPQRSLSLLSVREKEKEFLLVENYGTIYYHTAIIYTEQLIAGKTADNPQYVYISIFKITLPSNV